MARRRDKGLLELLALAPWWVSVIVAAAVYAGSRLAPSFVHSDRPLLAGLNALAEVLSNFAHWIAFPFLLVAGISALNAYRRRSLFDSQSDIESIRNLSWQEFELLVGEWFRRQGFAVEENGGGGADGGIDLLLRREGQVFLVQCKHWKTRQIGVAPVRELYGLMRAANASGAFFVTSGSLSREAKRFAEENQVTFLEGEALSSQISNVRLSALSREPATNNQQSPNCPLCRVTMVLRTAKRGQNVGKQFWGCSKYPACTAILECAAMSPLK